MKRSVLKKCGGTLAATLLLLQVAATPVLAQANAVASNGTAKAPDATRGGTELILLGTQGGPIIRKFRSQPANLLVVNGRPYLVDAGEGVIRQLQKTGFQPTDLRAVFLTHLHLDHVAGLAPLIGFSWLFDNKGLINVYGPPGTTNLVSAATKYMAEPVSLFAAQNPGSRTVFDIAKVKEVDAGGPTVIYQDDLIKVTAVANTHYDTMKRNPFPYPLRSYAYRIDTPDRSITFTGDTGPSDAVAALAKGSDILVSEIIDLDEVLNAAAATYHRSPEQMRPVIDHLSREHLTPMEVGKLASRAQVKMVVLTHLALGEDGEPSYQHYVNGVRKEYSGPVVVGEDLAHY